MLHQRTYQYHSVLLQLSIVARVSNFACRLNTFADFLKSGFTQTLPGLPLFTSFKTFFLKQDCRLHFISPSSLYFYEGRTQTLTTKCFAFRWVFNALVLIQASLIRNSH